MLSRILAAVAALLVAFAVHQHNQIQELQRAVGDADARAVARARRVLPETLVAENGDVQRALASLQAFYRSPEGLGRPDGLWVDGHPDYEGIGAWVFGVYVPRRLRGDDDQTARMAMIGAIKATDEWRRRHPAP